MKMQFETPADVNRWLESIIRADPVPCNGCTACCRNKSTVDLMPDDDLSLYEHISIREWGGELHPMLSQKPNGDCAYLEDGKCSIYDKRPVVCRVFDCRRERYAFDTRAKRRAAVRKGLFAQEIFDAGAERLHTMNLTPEEVISRMWEGHADFMLSTFGQR